MTSAPEQPEPPKRLREGYTTGACSAAAAKAAARVLVRGQTLTEIETTLPNGRKVTFSLKRCERLGQTATCGVIKDAGDDPDCTHGAELVAEVTLKTEPGVELRGGRGVATVTKPGLGLDIGSPAINPVPRKNIAETVMEELAGSAYGGAVVTISVPGGEEMAQKTINARLGLIGGISILGTTGIVKPYSTSAFKASVVQAIDVAASSGSSAIVLTTGGRTEAAAMKLFPGLPEHAFIQMGDFVGTAIAHAAGAGLRRAVVVGMMGKLSKIAEGIMQTHASQGEVNTAFLAELAANCGASAELRQQIAAANTARHVLELCRSGNLLQMLPALCREAAAKMRTHAGDRIDVWVYMVDFDGALLAFMPESASAGAVSERGTT